MEALHNFISAMIVSNKKVEIKEKETRGAYQGTCAQDIVQNNLSDQKMGAINKRKNSYSGFSMPYLKENMLQTLIM